MSRRTEIKRLVREMAKLMALLIFEAAMLGDDAPTESKKAAQSRVRPAYLRVIKGGRG